MGKKTWPDVLSTLLDDLFSARVPVAAFAKVENCRPCKLAHQELVSLMANDIFSPVYPNLLMVYFPQRFEQFYLVL